MPTDHLIDPASIDLSTGFVDKREVYSTLRQSGRFALIDGIVRFDPTAPIAIGFKDIRADDWWATDHIPGRPLFPGVLMIESAAQLSAWDHMMRHAEEKKFIGFGGVNETRFRGVVEPGVRLWFAARAIRVRRSMLVYSVQGFVDKVLVFETEIIGVAL